MPMSEDKKRGHPAKVAPTDSTQTALKSSSTIAEAADKNVVRRPSTGRRYWARQLIDRAPKPLPSYGSTEWLGLGADDPSKVAACVLAAECWASGADNLEDDLRREIEALQLGFKAGEDADYAARAEAHRAKWGNPSKRKSFVERRTDQIAATMPRPGDYPGGPVEWEGGPA